MSEQESDLKIRVGDGQWKQLSVRQFDVTETQPDSSEVPEFLHMKEDEIAEVGSKDENAGECDQIDEVEAAFAEGGKHAYAPAYDPVAEDEGMHGQPDGNLQGEGDSGEEEPDDASIPDWVQCIQGTRFFTLTQALVMPSALHRRTCSFSGINVPKYIKYMVLVDVE